METQKLLIKEAAIIFATVLFAFLVGYYYDSYTYAGLYLYSLLALLIFTPPLALIFLRIRKNQKLNKITLVLKIFLWLSVGLFTLISVGGIISEIIFEFKINYFYSPLYDPFLSLHYGPFLSLSQSIVYSIRDFVTPNYWLSGDWLEWPKWIFTFTKQLPSTIIYYSPYLVVAVLLVWADVVNKKMELKKD